MLEIAKKLELLLSDKLGISEGFGEFVYGAIAVAAMVAAALGINWLIQLLFKWITNSNGLFKKHKWHGYLVKRRLGHNILLLIPGGIMYVLPYLFYGKEEQMIR